MILVSACLFGLNTRYNGKKLNMHPMIKKIKNPLLLCPEQLAGFPTPRAKLYLQGKPEDIFVGNSRVINSEGKDITEQLMKGIKQVIWIVKKLKIKKAILKSDSPSCGAEGLLAVGLKKLNLKIKWVK